MKKKIILEVILSILLIPFVSAFISPEEELYSRGELYNAILGNDIFFGGLVVIGLGVVGYLVWKLVNGKKRK